MGVIGGIGLDLSDDLDQLISTKVLGCCELPGRSPHSHPPGVTEVLELKHRPDAMLNASHQARGASHSPVHTQLITNPQQAKLSQALSCHDLYTQVNPEAVQCVVICNPRLMLPTTN